MNIYAQIFVIFAILMLQFHCNLISEYDEETVKEIPEDEETRLETPEEYYSLDDNSTYSESDGEYPKLKRIESEPSYKEPTHTKDFWETCYKHITKDSKDFSGPSDKEETITINAKIHIPNNYSEDFSKDGNQPHYEDEMSDSLTEKFGTENTKHQLRNLKYFKAKDDESIRREKKINLMEEQENPSITLNLNIGLGNEKKRGHEVLEYASSNVDSPLKKFFIELLNSDENLPLKIYYYEEDLFNLLNTLDIFPSQLLDPVNPEIMISLHKLYKKFCILIEKDIRSNILPLVFYQMISPVIKDILPPHLEKLYFKKIIVKIENRYDIPKHINRLLSKTNIPKDVKEDSSIYKFIKLVDKTLGQMMIEDKEINRKLAKLYKKNIKLLQDIIDQDIKENKIPLNLFNIPFAIKEIPNFVNMIRNRPKKLPNTILPNEENSFAIFLKSLESSEDEEFSEDEHKGSFIKEIVNKILDLLSTWFPLHYL